MTMTRVTDPIQKQVHRRTESVKRKRTVQPLTPKSILKEINANINASAKKKPLIKPVRVQVLRVPTSPVAKPCLPRTSNCTAYPKAQGEEDNRHESLVLRSSTRLVLKTVTSKDANEQATKKARQVVKSKSTVTERAVNNKNDFKRKWFSVGLPQLLPASVKVPSDYDDQHYLDCLDMF
jgi:hypothetical protein